MKKEGNEQYVGSLERRVDTKYRISIPVEWGKEKDFLVWIGEQEHLIEELKNSKQEILAIIVPSEKILRTIYAGNNFFDDVYSRLYEPRKDKTARIILPPKVKKQLDGERDVTFVGCVEYIVLIKGKVKDLLDKE
jgi:DNA-binding transcriptional regulator/RsmH inhibitor MraZ